MKKFYFFLVAMLVSVAASATSVYFENTLGWSSVNCYCWAPEVSKWPGDAVTETITIDGRTFYVYNVPGDQTNVIFSGDGAQTKDLATTDGAVYSGNNVNSIDPIGTIKDGVFTPAGEIVIDYAKIYIPVSEWDKAGCYIYSWSPSLFGGWPGKEMSKVTINDEEYWTIDIDSRELTGNTINWKLNYNGDESDNVENAPMFINGHVYKLDGTSGQITAVEGIEVEENAAPVYYNLQGVRVAEPTNGLYIVVRGDKVVKELVK